MMYGVSSKSIRFTGRWNVTDKQAITTAPGGTIEISYVGKMAILHFDINTNEHPYPHLWIKVDGGAKVEVSLTQYIRVEAENEGTHYITVIFKGAVERQHRWYQPLIGKVSFCGFEADGEGILKEDTRKIIEFIGDSITEGVLIDAEYDPNNLDQPNRVYQDDVTATYAYLTAQNLNLKPIFMGYGATGITCSGQGSVPETSAAYPYCYNDAPISKFEADYTVINIGTNDGRATSDEFVDGMRQLLNLILKLNPKTKIAVMIPFYGRFCEELKDFIPAYNKENNKRVLLVDTTGWLPQLPVHPGRDGHRIAADKLTEILATEFK